MNPNLLPSRFQIGDDVRAKGVNATVVAVMFTVDKVTYQVGLRAAGAMTPPWWLESQCVEPPYAADRMRIAK